MSVPSSKRMCVADYTQASQQFLGISNVSLAGVSVERKYDVTKFDASISTQILDDVRTGH